MSNNEVGRSVYPPVPVITIRTPASNPSREENKLSYDRADIMMQLERR
jgi:hypothetical protein